MKHEKTVKELLEVLGGKDNISNYEHCATRLRVVLKDDDVVDKEEAENITENKGYFYSTGQHQFVFGTGLLTKYTLILNKKCQEVPLPTPIHRSKKTLMQI